MTKKQVIKYLDKKIKQSERWAIKAEKKEEFDDNNFFLGMRSGFELAQDIVRFELN